jgi:prefoldin subunit 5
MSNRKQPSSRGWIGSLVATAISLAVALVLAVNSRLIVDNYNYYSYHPDATIASFVSRAGMGDRGKFFFYASQPALESAQNFNTACGRAETTTAILGCYSTGKIYIYDIRDARLTGIRTTTAAHEMLHAAYERLGPNDKKQVDKLLEAEFETLKTNNKDLAARMAYYDRTEPGERDNELHSVIGTEISTISPELETYYRRYFTDRSKVVALHTQYESVFASLQARADQLNNQINSLDTAIKSDTADYNREAEALKSDISNFNDRAQRGDFSSQTEFSAGRSRLVARVNALEDLRTKINSNIQEYNQLVAELNSIATQTEDLNRSIDSSLASPPSL